MKDVSFKEVLMKTMADIHLTFPYDRTRVCKHVKECLDLILIITPETGRYSFPYLYEAAPKLWESRQLVQSHTNSKWWNGLNAGGPAPESDCFTVTPQCLL